MPLTKNMVRALEIVDENKIVFAGANTVRSTSPHSRGFATVRVNVSTLNALIARGILKHVLSPDGGFAAVRADENG